MKIRKNKDWKTKLENLGINDFFELEGTREANNAIYSCAKNLGIKIRMNSIPGGVLRIWRAK